MHEASKEPSPRAREALGRITTSNLGRVESTFQHSERLSALYLGRNLWPRAVQRQPRQPIAVGEAAAVDGHQGTLGLKVLRSSLRLSEGLDKPRIEASHRNPGLHS